MTSTSDDGPTGPATGGAGEGDGWFDARQRATVAAAMARMIPTDDTPGAAEAGCVDFLDRYLSGIGQIYATPTGDGFVRLTGRRASAWTRRIAMIRERYATGLKTLDAAAHDHAGADFVDLGGQDQDTVLRAVERPSGREQEADLARARTAMYGAPVEPALQQTSAETDLGFVPLLALHTRQAFYSDPVYGGNRDRVGWEVIGFPGPASLAEVHEGRYTTIDYFAEERVHPGTEGTA